MAKIRRAPQKKRRVKWGRLVFMFVLVAALAGALIFNWNRIRLWKKGYNLEQQNIILNMEPDERAYYLNADEAFDMDGWDKIPNDHHYYEYMIYKQKTDASDKEIVAYVDGLFKLKDQLGELGYSFDTVRSLMTVLELDDYKYFVEKKIKYADVEEFLNVKGCIAKDLPEYVKHKGSNPIETVLAVSYPNINSSLEAVRNYMVDDPANPLVLVKSGFMVPADYEPELKAADLPADPDAANTYLQKDAANALEKMAKDASKEGLAIAIRSAYRSYADQADVYNSYIEMYGYEYGTSLAAYPGTSEHQLGLGVDLSSLEVIDGIYNTFDESPEYLWVLENAHKYGFILRYPEAKIDFTGTMSEPWHFRYVGVDAATEMYEKDWCLEEYILNHGFDYNLSIVEE